MPLEEYDRKRDFSRTKEPPGGRAKRTSAGDVRDSVERITEDRERSTAPGRRSFVVQKHAASRLHYDFRLELDGVLLSWAVPKGPSLDPHDKRLAVRVEDHPLDYAGFEGTIPKGEYGGGTVIVWDRGWWEPLGEPKRNPDADPRLGLEKGSLKFALHGEKLDGTWALVRMKPRPNEHAENWLLIKERDAEARPSNEFDAVVELPRSVVSGLTVEEVTEAAERAPAPPEGSPRDNPSPARAEPGAAPLGTDPLPADAPMQLATLVERPPSGEGWIHEAKYDGYRVRALLEGGRARLLTRSAQDWTGTFPALARAIESLPASSVMLDGEVVVLDERGISDFRALQDAIADGHTERITYIAFDLLYLDGHDLRAQPLAARKELLGALLAGESLSGPLRCAEHVAADAGELYREACALELEGVVSKRADRPWVAGRTRDWVKVKCVLRQEFVIGGFTEPQGSREGLGALLLGVYGERGELRYAGRVGTGFTERVLVELRARLDHLAMDTPPFVSPPRIPGHTAHWVRPELVAEVAFREWTRDGLVRQPSFRGLRSDKPASEVVREAPQERGDAGPEAGDLAGVGKGAAPGKSANPDPAAPKRPSARWGAFGADVAVLGVKITNPEKLLFDDSPLTKLGLARYYERVAAYMLPHLANRPLTIVRCPIGAGRECFYQKHPDDGLPDAVRTIPLKERDGTGVYMYIEDLAGLIALVQMGVGEIHVWGSTVLDSEHPDRIIFDLDPGPGIGWRRIADAALAARKVLVAAGLTPFVKATGGKGLHVVVPVEPSLAFDEARAWARSVAEALVAENPGRLTSKAAKHLRPNKIFIDYLRNSHGATAIVPYSTRARPGAPVSVPLEWSELEGDRDVRQLSTKAVLRRLETLERDPWADLSGAAASAPTTTASATGETPASAG